ncbi:truncated I10L [African swine fever virus]|nr:truncated I10L [African swine fever virus]
MFYPVVQVLIGIILVIILILGFYHLKHKPPKKKM